MSYCEVECGECEQCRVAIIEKLRAQLATVTAERDEARTKLRTTLSESGQLVALARSEGWRDGRDNAAEVARQLEGHTSYVIATNIANLTETKGKEP